MSNKLRQRVSRLFIFFLFLIFGRRYVKFLLKHFVKYFGLLKPTA